MSRARRFRSPRSPPTRGGIFSRGRAPPRTGASRFRAREQARGSRSSRSTRPFGRPLRRSSRAAPTRRSRLSSSPCRRARWSFGSSTTGAPPCPRRGSSSRSRSPAESRSPPELAAIDAERVGAPRGYGWARGAVGAGAGPRPGRDCGHDHSRRNNDGAPDLVLVREAAIAGHVRMFGSLPVRRRSNPVSRYTERRAKPSAWTEADDDRVVAIAANGAYVLEGLVAGALPDPASDPRRPRLDRARAPARAGGAPRRGRFRPRPGGPDDPGTRARRRDRGARARRGGGLAACDLASGRVLRPRAPAREYSLLADHGDYVHLTRDVDSSMAGRSRSTSRSSEARPCGAPCASRMGLRPRTLRSRWPPTAPLRRWPRSSSGPRTVASPARACRPAPIA